MRKRHAEYRARVRVVDPDVSAVRFHDQLAEGETKAPVAAVPRLAFRELNEAFEDALALIHRDAASRVGDPKLGGRARARGLEPHGAPFGSVPDGVVDQVLEHTAQQVSIGVNAGATHVGDQRDTRAVGASAKRIHYLAAQRREVGQRPYLPARRHTVQLRHFDVEEHAVRRAFGEGRDGLLAVLGEGDVVPFVLQRRLRDRTVLCVVVCDENQSLWSGPHGETIS
jgi:hypothetical protein